MSEDASDVRLHARVAGRVQGVGFRATTISVARRLGLAGWVRNLPSGDVELEAAGPRAALEELVAFLAVGPRGARVTGVFPEWLPNRQENREDLTPLPTPFGMR
ncbi:MAG TPA: acylphosphatase [Polyangia bacterium]